MSLDHLLFRRRSADYDCLDFLAEAWLHVTGEDLRGRLGALQNRGRQLVGFSNRFQRLTRPISPCVVVMQAGDPEIHAGLYLNGRIMHLLDRAEYTAPEVATRGFSRVRFYR